MSINQRLALVFSVHRPRFRVKDQLFHSFIVGMLLMIFCISPATFASVTCQGRFVNPITDICWQCLLPISIGPLKVGGGITPRKRDTENPNLPLCTCIKNNLPIPGITLGFWEPIRLVDITRTPYCMTSLGGIQMGPNDIRKISSYSRSYGNRIAHNSFYHVHYYVYPLIWWLELITDLVCLEKSTFDVAYLSELDPTWNDPKIQTLLNPESFLFGSSAAQAACSIDCTAATAHLPRDELFWCAGCWGNLYPFSGANADHVGGVQSSSLYVSRILAKMHRIGLAQATATNESKFPRPGSEICRKSTALKIKKSQYKLQMVYPSSSTTLGCWPLGLSDMAYSSFKEYPSDGQDWSYVIWRKKNCCAF